MTEANQSTTLTVRDIRRRWKPTKERLKGSPSHEQTLIRIHRCCSWLQRVEEIEQDGADDAVLIYRWIALNCLYGRWNETSREPVPERESLRTFMDSIFQHDQDGQVSGILEQHRKLVMAIYEDEYLSKYFWEEPTDERARKTMKTKFDARTWYVEKRYGMILHRLLERVYFLRCQLVHGAATFGSDLNRKALRRCSTMLGHLMPAFLLVLIDHGYDQDWGPLCYPPLRSTGPGGRRERVAMSLT